MPRPRSPHTVAQWVTAIREGRKTMADVPEIMQMPVQFQGMRWVERAFHCEAKRRKA